MDEVYKVMMVIYNIISDDHIHPNGNNHNGSMGVDRTLAVADQTKIRTKTVISMLEYMNNYYSLNGQ